jgi:hypothetical protein
MADQRLVQIELGLRQGGIKLFALFCQCGVEILALLRQRRMKSSRCVASAC